MSPKSRDAGALGPIVFVKYFEKGSTRFGGDQVAELLRERGHDAHSVGVARLPDFRDGIAVFIKTSRLDHLVRARMRGMLCVLDVHDTPCFKRRLKNGRLFHGVIFRNRRQHADHGLRSRHDDVIWHHLDDRYRPHEVPRGEFRPGYVGERRSIPWDDVPGLAFIQDESEWFTAARRLSCQISVRRPGREWLYKPGAKVSTAAACRALLVSTADESAIEMLGTDYPYFTEPERSSLIATLDKARAELGGPNCERAMASLERVRLATDPARIMDLYERYFGSLTRRFRLPRGLEP